MQYNLASAEEAPPRASFHGDLQIAWDATSLGIFKDCAWKYYLQIVRGYVPKHRAVALTFGIAFHKAMEAYWKLRVGGTSHDLALITALQKALIEGRNLASSDDNRRTIKTLCRAIVFYLDDHRDDPAETVKLSDGSAAVELSFRLDLHKMAFTGESYFLCGHMDRVVEFDGQVWIQDYKTTTMTLGSSFFSKFSPDNQMSLYALAGQVIYNLPISGVLIDGIQLAVGIYRDLRGFAPRVSSQLDEWLEDTLMWINLAEQYAKARSWPMNDAACTKWGGCPFRNVCNKAPEVRENFLRADFIIDPWDPLRVRD